ncbi:MAG: type I-E CRISPR-associated protein Cas5/CasD [Desulfovibrionaceae bacterium]
MHEYLVFQLYGPLMSWGDVAVGEERPSRDHPTRSAVIGLLAAALGVRRGEEDRLAALDQGLGLAVRVDAPGLRLRDYHTVQVAKEPKRGAWYACRADELAADEDWISTILSRREYLQDACFTVCVWRRGEGWPTLENAAHALRRPGFTPYLGRKACPAGLPFYPKVGEHAGPLEALAAYPLDVALRALLPEAGAAVYLDEADAEALRLPGEQTVTVRDAPASFARRQFDLRRERRVPVPAAVLRPVIGAGLDPVPDPAPDSGPDSDPEVTPCS